MFVVPSIRANRDPDARTEFLDQLTQECRVAAAKPLDIDWISDRSMSPAVSPLWASTPPRFSSRIMVWSARTGTKDRRKSHCVSDRLEVMTTAGYH